MPRSLRCVLTLGALGIAPSAGATDGAGPRKCDLSPEVAHAQGVAEGTLRGREVAAGELSRAAEAARRPRVPVSAVLFGLAGGLAGVTAGLWLAGRSRPCRRPAGHLLDGLEREAGRVRASGADPDPRVRALCDRIDAPLGALLGRARELAARCEALEHRKGDPAALPHVEGLYAKLAALADAVDLLRARLALWTEELAAGGEAVADLEAELGTATGDLAEAIREAGE